MTDHNWQDVYDRACNLFRQQPRASDEQTVLEHFRNDPILVENTIVEVAEALSRDEITWGWSALAARLDRAGNRMVIVDDATSRKTQLTRAEKWLNQFAHHLDEDHVISMLFGPPALSSSLPDLKRLEQTTRERPGRPMYEPLLLAAIDATAKHGQRPVKTSPGPLTPYDTPELRARMVALWRERQPTHADDIPWTP